MSSNYGNKEDFPKLNAAIDSAAPADSRSATLNKFYKRAFKTNEFFEELLALQEERQEREEKRDKRYAERAERFAASATKSEK